MLVFESKTPSVALYQLRYALGILFHQDSATIAVNCVPK